MAADGDLVDDLLRRLLHDAPPSVLLAVLVLVWVRPLPPPAERQRPAPRRRRRRRPVRE